MNSLFEIFSCTVHVLSFSKVVTWYYLMLHKYRDCWLPEASNIHFKWIPGLVKWRTWHLLHNLLLIFHRSFSCVSKTVHILLHYIIVLDFCFKCLLTKAHVFANSAFAKSYLPQHSSCLLGTMWVAVVIKRLGITQYVFCCFISSNCQYLLIIDAHLHSFLIAFWL